MTHGQVALMNHYRDCEGLHYGYADLGPPVLDNRRRADRSVLTKFCYDEKKLNFRSVVKYEQLVRQSPVHKLLETLLG